MIITGDCLQELPKVESGSVDLVFFDPPFNIGLDYPGYEDRRKEWEYFDWLVDIFAKIRSVLSPTASLWVQCGQTIQSKVHSMLRAMALHWRNSVVWHYTFGPHQKKKFVPSWQMLHWFTVDAKDFTFNDEAIRVPSARQLKYNDKRANPKGRIPDDVWIISRVCGTFRERVDHSCQTPLELLDRIITACSNPGDLVLDPTCGTGSAGVSALRLGRRFLGIELCAETAEKARRRIETETAEALT